MGSPWLMCKERHVALGMWLLVGWSILIGLSGPLITIAILMAIRSEGRQSLMDSGAHGWQVVGNTRNKTKTCCIHV